MAIVQKKMNVERSIYEMLQIVSISLTDIKHLRDLLAKPNCNIVNELDIQPNQICLIVKLYNNRPKLLPDSNEETLQICNEILQSYTYLTCLP